MKAASSLPFATLALVACAAGKSWTAALSVTTMTQQLKMMRTELPRSSFPSPFGRFLSLNHAKGEQLTNHAAHFHP